MGFLWRTWHIYYFTLHTCSKWHSTSDELNIPLSHYILCISVYEIEFAPPPPSPPQPCHGRTTSMWAKAVDSVEDRLSLPLSVSLSDIHACSILCRLPLDDSQIWEIKLPTVWAWPIADTQSCPDHMNTTNRPVKLQNISGLQIATVSNSCVIILNWWINI